jgi:hypothetical protein
MQVPAIGHTLARDLMPQIKDIHDFLDELELRGISHRLETLDPNDLKSTQSEFDANKVFQMMQNQGERKPIITSSDGYVLDGHHRWLEAHNKCEKVEAYVCDAPILDLLHHAKRYVALGIGLNEDLEAKFQSGGIEHKEFGPMLDSFVKFASNKLGLKSLPNIRYKDASDEFNSFACYNPGKKHIVVSTKGRHPMDVFRSVAHELVHQHQDETDRLYPGAGETGSDIEDEANYMAGRIMRHWAKENPQYFHLAHVKEAVFVVGGPCSGKDKTAKYLKELYDATEIDVQSFNEDTMKKIGGNLIINASADQLDLIKQAQIILEEGNRYSTQLYFVDTSNEISKLRNEARGEKGQRVLSEGVRFAKFITAQKSKKVFSEMFRKDFHVIDNSIQEASNEVKVKIQVDQPKKSASTRKAIKTSSKPAPKSAKPKTNPDPDKVKLDLEAQKQKFQMDSEARKLDHEKQIQFRDAKSQHYNMRAQEFQVRINALRNAMSRLQPVGTNYTKVHKHLKQQLAGAILGMRKWQKQSLNQYAEPTQPSVNEEFENMFEHAGEWGTNELRSNYQKDTPGQPQGFQEPFGNYSLYKGVEKYLAQKKVEDSKPEEPNIEQVPQDDIGQSLATSTPAWPQARAGIGGIGAMTEAWLNNPKTVERFKARYADKWEEKILETAKFLDAQNIEVKLKSIKQFNEEWYRLKNGSKTNDYQEYLKDRNSIKVDRIEQDRQNYRYKNKEEKKEKKEKYYQESIDKGVGDMGTVPSQGKEEEIKPVEECGPLNSKVKIIKRKQ